MAKKKKTKPKVEVYDKTLSAKTIKTMATNGIGHKNLLSIIKLLDKK